MPTNSEKAALVRTAISDPVEESNWWEELLAYIYDTNEAATSGGGGGGGGVGSNTGTGGAGGAGGVGAIYIISW